MILKSVTTCKKHRMYNTEQSCYLANCDESTKASHTYTKDVPLSYPTFLPLLFPHFKSQYYNGRQLWPVNLPWLSAVGQGRISMGVCGGGFLHSAYHGSSVLAAHVPKGKETLWRTTFSPVGLGHTHTKVTLHTSTHKIEHTQKNTHTNPLCKKTQIFKFSILFNILKN